MSLQGLVIMFKRTGNCCARATDLLIACYAFGIAWGNVFAAAELNKPDGAMFTALDLISQGAVALSLPLLLFQVDIMASRGPAIWCLVSMLLGAVAVVFSTVTMHYAFVGTSIEGSSHIIAALITAVCVGGTPNMAAVRVALRVPATTFIAVHTSEVVIGAIYVLAMMTVWKRALKPCFREYDPEWAPLAICAPAKKDGLGDAELTKAVPELESKSSVPVPALASPLDKAVEMAESGHAPDGAMNEATATGTPTSAESDADLVVVPVEEGARDMAKMSEGVESFVDMMSPRHRCGIFKALGIAVVIVGIGAGIGLLAGSWSTMVTILLITALSVVMSLFKAVRDLPHSFTVGEYIVLVFCTVVGMMADLRALAETDPLVLASVTCMMVLAVAVHHLLAGLARIDTDTFIVSSAANLLSPPFVGVACKAVDNKALIAPGVTAGLVGYALGNFLGVAVGTLLVA